MTDPNLSTIASYYTDKLQKHGDSPQGVDWKDAASQQMRYQIFADLLPSPVGTLLDFGCGTGAFLSYLLEHGHSVDRYVGIDLSATMRACVEKKFSGGPLIETGTSLEERGEQSVDYAVALGTFLVKLGNDSKQWESYVFQTIEKLAVMAKKGVLFNFMTTVGIDFRMEHLFYKSPVETFDWAVKKFRYVSVQHAYPLYEYTVFINRSQPRRSSSI